MTIPFRTRMSVHLVAALSARPIKLFHFAFVVVALVLPLFAAEDAPALLVLFWPLLLTWVMFYFAAKEEASALPDLYALAMARRDPDAIAVVTHLLRLVATSGTPNPRRTALLVYALTHGGHPDEGAEIARRALARTTPAEDRSGALEGALGIALAVGGRLDDSIAPLEASLLASPNAPEKGERAYWLGMAYRATGRDDEARAKLRIAAESDSSCAEDARALLDKATLFRG